MARYRSISLFGKVVMPIILVGIISALLGVAARIENRYNNAALPAEEAVYQQYIERKTLEENDSFYQKLADGFEVNILVAGDSIGANSGAGSNEAGWTALLKNHIKDKYGVRSVLTNVSLGGGTAYTDYVRTLNLSENKEYDLAIICCGQNDSNTDFGVRYEALIRAIRSRNEKCSIIAILESSQRSYTEKINIIKGLCDHYGIFVADTILPFTDGSNGEYSTLTTDGVHPNAKGYAIYAKTINEIIDNAVEAYTEYDPREITPMYEGVENYHNFKYISAKQFLRKDNTYTYTVNESISGICGIDYSFVPGENSCRIFIDNVEFAAPERYFDYDFTQRQIMIVNKEYMNVEKTIDISFANSKQADKFNGICFSWK